LPALLFLHMQSAAAFMAFSHWASRVGVFINLESIGPGGSPIVFQHAGAWTIEAFSKGAVHPRGAIAAQVGAVCGCLPVLTSPAGDNCWLNRRSCSRRKNVLVNHQLHQCQLFLLVSGPQGMQPQLCV
jgi:hypothetical protein